MKATAGLRSDRPEIIENYRDFQPPANLRKWLNGLLDAVPAEYLVGLKTIVLTNRPALNRNQRRQKVWSRNRKIRLAEALGSYSRATRSAPAAVWMYVDNIVQSKPSWFMRVPMFRYHIFGSVLYHEIGHHIHAVHKPVYDGKENVAEDWSEKLFKLFVQRRYWYLRALTKPVRLFLEYRKRRNPKNQPANKLAR